VLEAIAAEASDLVEKNEPNIVGDGSGRGAREVLFTATRDLAWA
jgi:hypothetical protein